MSWTIIGVLIIVGFLFLLLEVLVLPGTNIAGILGFVLIAVGVWQAFEAHGSTAGIVTLSGTVVFSFFVLYYALKSKTWKRASLASEIDGRVNVVDATLIKPGDTGVAVSRLNPMGKALINNQYYEVRTDGEYIIPETEIVVTKIDFNKITVKSKV